MSGIVKSLNIQGMRSIVLAVVLTVIGGVSWVSSAAAQLPASIQLRAERTHGGEAVYRLRATAGSQGASFGFELRRPAWPFARTTAGSPITIASVRLEGQGLIQPSPWATAESPGEGLCRREKPTFDGPSYWMAIPAGATAVAEVHANATYPAWPGTKYTVSFLTFEKNSATAPRTKLGAVTTGTLGKRGSHIGMRATRERLQKGSRRLSPGIDGWTKPRLANTRISLRAIRSSGGGIWLGEWMNRPPYTVRLGQVLTDAMGHFHLESRAFPYQGRYVVVARSARTRKLAADWNCGPSFRVAP